MRNGQMEPGRRSRTCLGTESSSAAGSSAHALAVPFSFLVLVLLIASTMTVSNIASAQPASPSGTVPMRVDGSANYSFRLGQGDYYLGLAADPGKVVNATLRRGADEIVSKSVSYWGARRLPGLIEASYTLTLAGFGWTIIASDAQWPGTYSLHALSVVSFFLTPQGESSLDIRVASGEGNPVRLAVFDGFLGEVASKTPDLEHQLRVSLGLDRADAAYVVVVATGEEITTTLTWAVAGASSPGTSEGSALLVALLVATPITLVAACLVWRRRNARLTHHKR